MFTGTMRYIKRQFAILKGIILQDGFRARTKVYFTIMKFVGILVIFAVLTYASAGVMPVYDGPIYEMTLIDEPANDGMTNDGMTNDGFNNGSNDESENPIRQRRITCDVLSFQSKWWSFNHSACAIKCRFQRRRGGSCQNGVCICR